MTEALKIIYTDRTRQITYQKCPRERYLYTHFGGIGITRAKLIIPLATGTYTHDGLRKLLEGQTVEAAIQHATQGYWTEVRRRGIEVNPGEDSAQVADEQVALVEGMLRAYAKRRLPSLLSDFEVLETEREEEWPLTEWKDALIDEDPEADDEDVRVVQIRMMSRADALLLERSSGDLYIQSYKTAAQYDHRMQNEAEHDVQGLSEMAAVEYRLNQWWSYLQQATGDQRRHDGRLLDEGCSSKMFNYLVQRETPPRIAGIRMEYLLKGRREQYPKDSGTYAQYSPLIRAYVRFGAVSADFGWKREYADAETGQTRRLDYRTWKATEMWKQPGGISAWIDLLDTGSVQPEAGDCLDQQFVTPVPYFRQDDDLRDWYEQTVVQEKEVAAAVGQMQEIEKKHGRNSGEFRSALNYYFRQHRRSCDWPSPCQFVDVCYSTNVRENPIQSGLYIKREPHHAPEMKAALAGA